MALAGRGVTGGTDITVLVDPGATGDMQLVKLAYSALADQTPIGADANGLDVDVTRIVPGTGATNLGKAEDAAHTSGDTGVMALGVIQSTIGTGVGASGDYVFLQMDSNGRLRTISYAEEVTPSNSTTTALDNDGPIVKASAGTLYGFQGYCDAAGFVQVHNKATAPTSSNVPVIVIPIASGAAFSLDLGTRGRAFSTGIVFGFSSTGPTYTDGGSHLWVDAQFV